MQKKVTPPLALIRVLTQKDKSLKDPILARLILATNVNLENKSTKEDYFDHC